VIGSVATAPLRKARPRPVLDSEAKLDVVGHLDELRKRLLVAVVALTAGFGGAFAIHKWVIDRLNEPLNGTQPVTLSIAEPFMTAMKVSIMLAFAFAFPVLMWQLWRYIAPTFQVHVRRSVATYVGSGSVLLVVGMAFGYFIALPSAVGFLTSFDADLYDVQVRAQDYYMFATAVLLSVGLVFQLPVILLGLVRFRIVSRAQLAGNRKIAYVSLTALAVLMPGVDPVTTTMWIVPLGLLFEASIVLAHFTEKRAAKQLAAESASETDPELAA